MKHYQSHSIRYQAQTLFTINCCINFIKHCRNYFICQLAYYYPSSMLELLLFAQRTGCVNLILSHFALWLLLLFHLRFTPPPTQNYSHNARLPRIDSLSFAVIHLRWKFYVCWFFYFLFWLFFVLTNIFSNFYSHSFLYIRRLALGLNFFVDFNQIFSWLQMFSCLP